MWDVPKISMKESFENFDPDLEDAGILDGNEDTFGGPAEPEAPVLGEDPMLASAEELPPYLGSGASRRPLSSEGGEDEPVEAF